MSTTINITAGKQVGELAKSYENLKTVQEQATIMKQNGTPIISLCIVNQIPGDQNGVASNVAALMTTEQQSALDDEFLTKISATLASIKAEFEAQVELAVDGDDPADPVVTP